MVLDFAEEYLEPKKPLRAIRILDGFEWVWESDGENIRMYKYKKLLQINEKEITIENYAEKLLESLNKNEE